MDISISDRLLDLLSQAIDTGLESIRFDTMTPFLLLHTREGRVIERFARRPVQEAIDRAQARAASLGRDGDRTQSYVLVYDSQLDVGDETFDALILQAGDTDSTARYTLAQRYRATQVGQPPQRIGQMALLEVG